MDHGGVEPKKPAGRTKVSGIETPGGSESPDGGLWLVNIAEHVKTGLVLLQIVANWI